MNVVQMFLFVLLVMVPIGGDGASLLQPAQFPTTSADFSFVERMENLAEGYEPYAGMSAYQIIELQAQEDIVDEAVKAELRAAGINDDYFMTPAEEAQSTQQVQTQPIIHATPIPATIPGSYGYCSQTHPGLTGQKIPFGMPLNTNDLNAKNISSKAYAFATRKNIPMYCDGYYCRPKPGNTTDRPHVGIDLGCKGDFYQMPVYATADGTVQLVSRGNAAGNFIRIDHGAGWKTQYKHLDKIFVTQGQQVSAGCLIGLMGHTGGNQDYVHVGISRDMTHLHYEILYSGSKTVVSAPNGNNVSIQRKGKCKNGKGFDTFIDPKPFVYYK